MYKKCPRCNLNYIQDTEQYCKVCLIEMRKINETLNVIDELEEDEEELVLCPECNENYLEEGEEICYACRIERMKQAAKENATGDDFDDDFVTSSDGKDDGKEVLMDNMESLDYPDGKLPPDDAEQEPDEL